MIVINFKDTGISGNGVHAVLMGPSLCGANRIATALITHQHETSPYTAYPVIQRQISETGNQTDLSVLLYSCLPISPLTLAVNCCSLVYLFSSA